MTTLKNTLDYAQLSGLLNGIAANMPELTKRIDGLSRIRSDELVEIGCKLRALKNILEAQDRIVTELIRPETNDVDGSVVAGLTVNAIKQVCVKLVLDTDKVKAYLAKKLRQYQKEQTVVSIVYRPKV